MIPWSGFWFPSTHVGGFIKTQDHVTIWFTAAMEEGKLVKTRIAQIVLGAVSTLKQQLLSGGEMRLEWVRYEQMVFNLIISWVPSIFHEGGGEVGLASGICSPYGGSPWSCIGVTSNSLSPNFAPNNKAVNNLNRWRYDSKSIAWRRAPLLFGLPHQNAMVKAEPLPDTSLTVLFPIIGWLFLK